MAWQDGPPPPVQCEVCGRIFTVSPMARRPKYCGRACQIVASTAIRSARRRERREEAEVTPQVLPAMPWRIAEAGLCTDPRTLAKAGYVWTSDDQADRDLARRICRSCPASIPCAEWSVASLPATDNNIYAGLGAFGRKRLRGQRRRPAPQPEAPRRTATA